jgi:2-oxoglutarate ferredoxin oxidoreductase subunit gamma
MAKTNGNSEIRIGGVGGQGIVTAGRLLGIAAALYDGKEAVCTQSYGPEARGGASRSDIIISDTPVDYPYVLALLIYDSGLVQPSEQGANVFGLPATKMADDLGSRLVTNIVILGYLVGKTGVVSRESLEQAIRENVREKHIDLDLRALDAGMKLAQSDGPS